MAVRIKNKLVFLEHRRTASTTVREALLTLGGKPYGRHRLIAKGPKEVRFSVIRNPYDLLVSWYHILKWEDFTDFLKNCGHRSMLQNGRLFYFAQYCDIFLCYDVLHTQLNNLLRHVRLPEVKTLLTRNVTEGKKDFREYYSFHMMQIVKSRFAADLELYSSLPGCPDDPLFNN